ncbi:GMC family oxidoreductase [Salegentibacter sp. F188]|uniref:GMC family oxidoreductase n=1 Tax=Autumnicola patrickiae TaxID=3075591 RepID=A0ABU3E4J6_9FLAO|nr:GMC family oxidoreductase [Salegentibacter sp. F188]MDT0690835.1 GMC family oxidoreductase [Salegentibacter sp. F188]
MKNKRINPAKKDRYDAIVIGTGITGGWASKELSEGGLTTLVLERGRMVKHVEDYPTMNDDPWDYKYKGQVTREEYGRQSKQARTGYTINDASKHWFVDDIEHPYNEEKRFDWIRGYHVGGKSLMWARMSFRWSEMDFEANKNDGYGVDWPIRYKDLVPWYEKVEKYIGITGKAENLPQLPDSIFTPEMPLNCVEQDFKEGVEKNFDDRKIINSRAANLTDPSGREGRGPCQYRNRCIRGCPYGAYFSSNSSTLPAAERTGNITLRPNSIVHEIIYDEQLGKATGVRVIDAETKEKMEFYADVLFCCAGAIPSASILMQSKSDRFPNGIGNDSGELGHNLMDHHFKVGASAISDSHKEDYYKGRKPAGFFVPRFRNVDEQSKTSKFLRGYGMQGSASRTDWTSAIGEMNYGKELKEALQKPGDWQIGVNCFGECLPYHENKMMLNYDKPDQWGLPTITFDCEYKENEMAMRKDAQEQAVAMLKAAGFKDVKGYDDPCFPGNGIHEMGTARMGRDPKTSVLNGNNQIHTVPNVYVTDGACMASSASQNPSLTYMALTARAANHAVEQFKAGKFRNEEKVS